MTVYNPPNAQSVLGVANVKDYLKGDGTDESTAFLTLLANVHSAGGGDIVFPPNGGVPWRVDSQVVFPNDGGSPPRQRAIRLLGAGSAGIGAASSTPYGGAQLDLRYQGATGPGTKIDTRGAGTLTIMDLTLLDQGTTGTSPFIQTTNTTLKIVRVEFYGQASKSGTGCDCDAIILGGTATGAADGTSNSPFQGYGTVIDGCHFNRIRRGVYGRTYCNAVVVRDNSFWNQCGSNLAGGAAIEFIGDVTNGCTGELVIGNLIEMVGYPYGIKADNTSNSSFVFNNFYDAGGTTTAYYRMEAGAVYNTIAAGAGADSKTWLSDASGTKNLFITGHQSQNIVVPASGKLQFGTSSTTAIQDNGAGRVYFVGRAEATANGVATKTKAGAVVDGDFTVTPIDGTLAVDTTNSKIYVRIGGTWKSVTVA